MHPPLLKWPILYLVRGLSGSGKTTLARTIAGIDKTKCISADDHFYTQDPGEMNPRYEFDRSKVPQAHDQSQEKTNYWLTKGYSVVVHNTFSCRWEMQPYLEAAERHNARVAVLDLFDAGLSDEELSQRGLHSVPVEVISRMRERWEHDWGDANPLAPRKRKKGSHG